MYDLHNLHVQPSDYHFLILTLNSVREVDSLISLGTSSHVLGPIFLIVSVPYFTVITLILSQEGLFRKLYVLTFSANNACIGRGER